MGVLYPQLSSRRLLLLTGVFPVEVRVLPVEVILRHRHSSATATPAHRGTATAYTIPDSERKFRTARAPNRHYHRSMLADGMICAAHHRHRDCDGTHAPAPSLAVH